MGNQQSAPKGGGEVATKRDKQVSKRVSIQGLSQGKSTVANPSASKASATAQTAAPKNAQKPAMQQLQKAQSPELPTKPLGIERTERTEKTEKVEKTETKDVLQRDQEQPAAAPSSAEPMDVPSTMSRSRQDDFEESNFSRHYTPVSQMRPPRLPLPIADAQVDPVPESPTLGPVQTENGDVSNLYDDDPVSATDEKLRRRDSMLSATTQDDEEVGELQPYAVDTTEAKLVPVPIVWRHGGDKVFVTGTFATWQRKFKLHKSGDDPGVLATVIHLPPGTHHLKFIVDGEMRTTNDLPTAVDFTNVLVNYLEVSPEDMPTSRRESERGAKPIPPPLHPPLIWREDEVKESQVDVSGVDEPDMKEPPEEEIPLGDFRQVVPQALIDMELPEDDPKYQQAVNVIENVQGPPSLPLFLGRSILNGTLPMKDDSSVLSLPNHTVLNHLATSSIKNGVLATSVTTRYKKKYVTTIMYKATDGLG